MEQVADEGFVQEVCIYLLSRLFLVFYLIICRFGDKATTSASPSRILNCFALLFLVLTHGSALFAVSRCNSGSISSVLILPLPADHS